MTVLIESKLSGRFFSGFGCWVSDPSRAIAFADIETAQAFVCREHLTDVRVVPFPNGSDHFLLTAA